MAALVMTSEPSAQAIHVRGAWPRAFVLVAAAALASLLGWAAWVLLAHQATVVAFPHPLDYGEGPILDHVLRLSHGENPYPADLSRPPYHIGVYPPGYALLQVPFFWAFGPALWYGRALSAVAIWVAALACAGIAHRATGSRSAGALGGSLLLASPFVVYWSPLARIDCVALAVSLCGLWVAIARGDRRGGRVLAALLFVFAAYTRQSAIVAAPLAAFVFCWRSFGLRRALELTAATALPGFVLLAWLQWWSGGGFFFDVVGAHDVLFLWSTVREFALEAVAVMPLLLGVAFGYAALAVRRAAPLDLGIATLLVASAGVALSSGKFGSNVNYLLEPVASVAIACAVAVHRLRSKPLLQAALLVLLALQAVHLVVTSQDDYAKREMWKLDARDDLDRLQQYVDRTQGPVVADEFMAMIPLANKRLVFQPFAFTELARAGVWDEAPLVEDLRSGAFDLLLVYQPPDWSAPHARWSPAMIAAIEAGYTLEEQIAYTLVARPTARSRARSAGPSVGRGSSWNSD